jgi:macrolide-specific efflux system membrane fusion protein
MPRPADKVRNFMSTSQTVVRPRVGFFKRRLTWLGMFVLLLGGGLVLARGSSGGTASATDKSLLATVKKTDLEVVVLETGRVEPLLQTQIKSKVGGQVTRVEVEEGARVKKGHILLRVDPTDYRRDVARVEAEIAQLRESVNFSLIKLDRSEKARAIEIAPAQELDQARHEAALSRAQLKAAEVALATARDRLRYTEIDAPFDGTVIQRNVQPGEVVVPGMTATMEGRPLLMLADMSVLLVKTDLNQIDVARVAKGQKAQVTLDALPDKKFTATVTRVAAAAVTVNQRDTFPVEAALDANQDLSAIKPGMTADVRILIEKKPGVLVLPIEAVVTEKGKSLVHRLMPSPDGKSKVPKTAELTVALGARNDREVEIKSGIKEGEQVLIKPPKANEVNF